MFDIHLHGGGGIAFDDILENKDAIDIVINSHKDNGTEKFFIGFVTDSIDNLLKKIDIAKTYCKENPEIAKGIYLEGPFLSPLKKGAHDPLLLTSPQKSIVNELISAGDGFLKMITIAPELENGYNAIQEFENNGVIAAIGHTNIDYNETLQAIDAGGHHFTHLYNAMNSISHRTPGPVIAALDSYKMGKNITVELVVDGFHLAPQIVKNTFDWFSKDGKTNVVLVTDSMSAANMEDGEYKIGQLPVTVKNSKATLSGTDTIAGSTLNLQTAYNNAIKFGVNEDLVKQSSNPASILNLL